MGAFPRRVIYFSMGYNIPHVYRCLWLQRKAWICSLSGLSPPGVGRQTLMWSHLCFLALGMKRKKKVYLYLTKFHFQLLSCLGALVEWWPVNDKATSDPSSGQMLLVRSLLLLLRDPICGLPRAQIGSWTWGWARTSHLWNAMQT